MQAIGYILSYPVSPNEVSNNLNACGVLPTVTASSARRPRLLPFFPPYWPGRDENWR